MVDLGFIYMMWLKEYLQYERGKSRKAGKSREAEKRKSKGTGDQKSQKIKNRRKKNGSLPF